MNSGSPDLVPVGSSISTNTGNAGLCSSKLLVVPAVRQALKVQLERGILNGCVWETSCLGPQNTQGPRDNRQKVSKDWDLIKVEESAGLNPCAQMVWARILKVSLNPKA